MPEQSEVQQSEAPRWTARDHEMWKRGHLAGLNDAGKVLHDAYEREQARNKESEAREAAIAAAVLMSAGKDGTNGTVLG